ncbi:hypothetical protein FS842_008336 [Serendipita sp. 407]|nr:hypothetical protein FS842_008336 [Serendipita sp. 407]
MFQNVPYDVFPLLFEHLDQESLLNVVLVNRTFNEAASPVLYSNLLLEFVSLTWDTDDFEPEGLRRNPFQAFERRPGLRNAVRNVDITTRYDKPIKATDPTTLKALCHKEFSLFCNIRSISINGGYYEWADSSFLWCIVQDIETLQVLKLGDLSNSATLFFPNVKEFECRVWRPNKLGIGSYANRVHKLDFYSLNCDLGDFKPFSNLRVLILGRIKLPLQNGSLSVLASFPALTHLRLSPIIITSSLDFQHSYQPTNLTGLTHLTISLSQRDPTFIDSTLCWLVKSIAGHSRHFFSVSPATFQIWSNYGLALLYK